MSEPVPVTVYRREQCELCEVALDTVESVAADADVAVEIETVDVDADPSLADRYGERVPVVFVDGRHEFDIRVDPTVLVGVLREASEA